MASYVFSSADKSSCLTPLENLVTFSQAFKISSRNRRSSRDTTGILTDFIAQLGPQPAGCNQVDFSTQNVFKKELEVHIAVECCRSRKLDQEIHITVRARLAVYDGTKN